VIEIGIGPDSWGVWFGEDARQPPWTQFLDEVVEAGYSWIERGPEGYLPLDVPTLKAELDARNLRLSAVHAMRPLENANVWAALEGDVERACETAAALGAQTLVLIDDLYTDPLTGAQIAPRELDEAGWARLVDTTNRVADLARERWHMTLAFHPHVDTHVEREDQIERLLAETEPERVSLCFDIGHHAYLGADAVAFMRRHRSRISYLHLKNVDPAVLERVEREELPFAAAVTADVFTELPSGAVDMQALAALLDQTGYSGFAVIEQDMYPAPFDKPLPIAKRTREYLRELGVG
jgi:inosose dehydratase